jgi:hypothetical protein
MIVSMLAVLVTLGQPVADGVPTVVVTPRVQPSVTMDQRAKTFMGEYFQHFSSPDVLSRFEDDYAPYVGYYGKLVDRTALMREKARYVRRWPQRNYQLRPASLQVSCDQAVATCMVTGLVDFECRSAERHAVSTGVARFTAGIWFDGDHGQIVEEESQVIGHS